MELYRLFVASLVLAILSVLPAHALAKPPAKSHVTHQSTLTIDQKNNKQGLGEHHAAPHKKSHATHSAKHHPSALSGKHSLNKTVPHESKMHMPKAAAPVKPSHLMTFHKQK